MAKNIVVKLKKVGNRLKIFNLQDNYGNILKQGIVREELIKGVTVTVEDVVTVIILVSNGLVFNIPISTITKEQLASIKCINHNTGSIWKHLIETTSYNHYYGNSHKYIIEYPYSYKLYDEIVQSVQDYSKVYRYYPSTEGSYDINRKIQKNDRYFNKAILYNDEQSSGILNLIAKPINNLHSYLGYPKYNLYSKDITYTKSDNFYQFNTFWNIVLNKEVPLFVKSCENLSIDKEVNQENMIYSPLSFKKYKLRAKDVKIRMILEDNDIHIVSMFNTEGSQISYK